MLFEVLTCRAFLSTLFCLFDIAVTQVMITTALCLKVQAGSCTCLVHCVNKL